jgi:hypothetical protein
VDSSFAGELAEITALCGIPEQWNIYVDRAQDLVSRNHDLARQRLLKVVHLSKEIEQLASIFGSAQEYDGVDAS